MELPTCSFSENHPRGGVAGDFRARRLMSLHPGLKRLGYSVRPLRGHRKRSKHQRGEDLLQNRAAADSGWPIFNAPVGPRSVGRGLSLKITPRAAWCHSRTSICETAQMCRKSSNNPPTEELRSRIDTLVASRATRTIIIDAIPTMLRMPSTRLPKPTRTWAPAAAKLMDCISCSTRLPAFYPWSLARGPHRWSAIAYRRK